MVEFFFVANKNPDQKRIIENKNVEYPQHFQDGWDPLQNTVWNSPRIGTNSPSDINNLEFSCLKSTLRPVPHKMF